MTKSDGLFAWCWMASLTGYIATAMGLMNLNGAIEVALAAATGVYLGHIFIKRTDGAKLSAGLITLASCDASKQIIFYSSAALAACSVTAVVYYFIMWENRLLHPSLNALLVSPLAYYGFACGKLILRRSNTKDGGN